MGAEVRGAQAEGPRNAGHAWSRVRVGALDREAANAGRASTAAAITPGDLRGLVRTERVLLSGPDGAPIPRYRAPESGRDFMTRAQVETGGRGSTLTDRYGGYTRVVEGAET